MQDVADANRYQIQISGIGAEAFASVAPAFDCFLVAPHIQYKKEELKKAIKEGQHIEVIAGYPYAAIDAEKILKLPSIVWRSWLINELLRNLQIGRAKGLRDERAMALLVC
jgi:PTS system cellobiose-specific IIB component